MSDVPDNRWCSKLVDNTLCDCRLYSAPEPDSDNYGKAICAECGHGRSLHTGWPSTRARADDNDLSLVPSRSKPIDTRGIVSRMIAKSGHSEANLEANQGLLKAQGESQAGPSKKKAHKKQPKKELFGVYAVVMKTKGMRNGRLRDEAAPNKQGLDFLLPSTVVRGEAASHIELSRSWSAEQVRDFLADHFPAIVSWVDADSGTDSETDTGTANLPRADFYLCSKRNKKLDVVPKASITGEDLHTHRGTGHSTPDDSIIYIATRRPIPSHVIGGLTPSPSPTPPPSPPPKGKGKARAAPAKRKRSATKSSAVDESPNRPDNKRKRTAKKSEVKDDDDDIFNPRPPIKAMGSLTLSPPSMSLTDTAATAAAVSTSSSSATASTQITEIDLTMDDESSVPAAPATPPSVPRDINPDFSRSPDFHARRQSAWGTSRTYHF